MVTVCTTVQTVAQISGASSTGLGSGYPGMGADRTTSLAEMFCKGRNVRLATTTRSCPQGQSDAIGCSRRQLATNLNGMTLVTEYGDASAAVLQDEKGLGIKRHDWVLWATQALGKVLLNVAGVSGCNRPCACLVWIWLYMYNINTVMRSIPCVLSLL